jgi:hypothetical protein
MMAEFALARKAKPARTPASHQIFLLLWVVMPEKLTVNRLVQQKPQQKGFGYE